MVVAKYARTLEAIRILQKLLPTGREILCSEFRGNLRSQAGVKVVEFFNDHVE